MQLISPNRQFERILNFPLISSAMAHDEAHDAFMALPPYTRTREGEVRQLRSGPLPGGALREEMLDKL
jgi:hypothetical protein